MQNRFWLLAISFVFIVSGLRAQFFEPVSWKSELKDLGNGKAELIFKADIDKGWHLYTQEVPDGPDAPQATTFYFPENSDVERLGDIWESKSVTTFEELSGLNVSYFEDKAEFRVKVRNQLAQPVDYEVEVYFMACDDEKCIPPASEFMTFTLPAAGGDEGQEVEDVEDNSTLEVMADGDIFNEGSAIQINNDEEEELIDPVSWEFKIESKGGKIYEVIAKATVDPPWHIYSSKLEREDGPIATEFNIDTLPGMTVKEIREEGNKKTEYDKSFMMNLDFYDQEATFIREIEVEEGMKSIQGSVYYMVCDDERCLNPEEVPFDLEIPAPTTASSKVASLNKGHWATFIEGFLFGFVALLTPCVFPMIPLTVSFFTKQSKTRAKGISNALIYSGSIVAIYCLLGFGVTKVFGIDALNELSTNVWFNLFFFLMLVVFAISFFGAFEITLPSSWVNKADSASNRGGLIGIFFMAFTLSLVSFSCTGPLVGTLLFDAAVSGGVLGPLVGMAGFSLALALPFGLFAAFPGWLNSLPSSGGWLNSVKVVLGFLELAFAFKFLSNADLVWQAGLLKREVFIAIWIAIFAMMTMYLLGVYQLPHDSKKDRISVTRLMFAVASLMFTIYLIPGIWGAPLKLISGFPPPMFYSESPKGLGTGGTVAVATVDKSGKVVGEPEHCPHQLNCFHDYDEGLAYAKEVGKPVMLDFTGWACVNCRKMEEQVWSDPSILKILREDVVLISLYVDEKIELPKEEQITVQIGSKKKKLRTVGNKWSYLQAKKYKTNSQPYYIIMDHEENTMNGSAAYDPDIEKFRHWLTEGISKFHNKG